MLINQAPYLFFRQIPKKRVHDFSIGKLCMFFKQTDPFLLFGNYITTISFILS